MGSVMENLPVDNLVRAVYPGIELKRSEGENGKAGMPTLVGYFIVFNQWTEINSIVEGHFMERFAPGCLTKTIRENGERIQVLFDHGEDPSIGKKVLGKISVLKEDGDHGGYYEAPLLETSYNKDLIPGLKAGLYGSSMRFTVIKEDLNFRPKPSAYNPKGLPERTVTEARIKEFGPVPFPAYAGVTTGVRSMTDQFQNGASRTTAERDDDLLYKRSLDFVGNQAWAIHPSMMETMISIMGERVAGYRPSNQEIKERIGVRSAPPAPQAEDSPVAVINITGTIMPHATLMSEISGGGSIENYQAELQAALDNPDVQHIVLNIDSPGGSVAMLAEFAAQIRAARDVKPVTAVANTNAYSAAYWIATQANDISVSPSGGVGSVGVITAHQDVSAAMDMQGVKTTQITAGKYKGELSPFQPLTSEAQDRLQSEVDHYYAMFVSDIAKGRSTSTRMINENFGEGRTVMPVDAVNAGMADRVESFDQAMARIMKQYMKPARKMTPPKKMMGSNEASSTYTVTLPTTAIGTAGSGTNITISTFDGSTTVTGPVSEESSRSEERNDYDEIVAEHAEDSPPEKDEALTAELQDDSHAVTEENDERTSTSDDSFNSDDALVESGAGIAHSSATSRNENVGSNASISEEIKNMPNTGMTIEEVKARLDEIKARQKEIVAEFGTDPFSDAVKGEWDTMIPEREELLARVEDYKARQEILRAYNAETDDRHKEFVGQSLDKGRQSLRRKASRVPDNIYAVEDYRNLSGNADELREAYRDGAMRAIEITHFSHPEANREDAQSHIERLLDTADDESGTLARRILTTGSPTYTRAFSKYIVGSSLTAEEQRSVSLSSGGIAVPVVLDPTVVLTSNGVVNPIRQIARVETIVGNTWNGVSSAGVVASYAGEAVETSDNAPSFVQPSANVEKAQAFIPFTIEIGEDWGALQSEMARMLQDAKDTLEADKFLTGLGHGSTVPQGLLVGATITVSTAATATFAVADLYSLEEALPPRWRPRANFIANRKYFNKVRQFDTAGGASLWVQLGDGTPGRLIGYPSYEWSNMASAATSGSSIMTVGDFSNYLILDRIGMNIELIPHLLNTSNNRPDGTRGLYAYWRNTATVLTNKAFVTLKLL